MHLVAIARAAGITLTWDDLSDLSAVVPLLTRIYPNGEADVNHFHAAGGIAFLVHTLLEARAAARRRAHRRRARPVALHAPSPASTAPASCTLGGGPQGSASTPTCCAPADDPFSPDGGLRMLDRQPRPRGHQDLGGQARAPRRSPRPRVVFDDQDDFLRGLRRRRRSTAATSSRWSATRARPPTACPSCTSSPRRSACCRTAASGSRSSPTAGCPARPARCPPPSTSPPRPPSAARSRGSATATWSPSTPTPGASTCTSTRPSSPPAPATGRAPQGAEWSGTGRELFAAFRATVGPADAGASVFPGVTVPRQEVPVVHADSPRGSLLDRVPVVPVVVVDDVAHAVPVARALVAGGLPVIELTLRTPVALDAIEAIADEVPEILVGAGTVVDARAGQARRSTRAPSSWSPPARRPRCSPRCSDTGLPLLPGAATVSEVLRLLELGYTEMKFFPAEASGGAAFLKSIGAPVPAGAVLPDRRDHRGHRPVVPRAAERRLRRRLVAHPGGRAGRRRLGPGRAARPRGRRAGLTARLAGTSALATWWLRRRWRPWRPCRSAR